MKGTVNPKLPVVPMGTANHLMAGQALLYGGVGGDAVIRVMGGYIHIRSDGRVSITSTGCEATSLDIKEIEGTKLAAGSSFTITL